MGDMLRSSSMQLVQFIVENEGAHAVVSELGDVGLFEFSDLNEGIPSYQRPFVDDVRRCEEVQRKLRFLNEELNSLSITPRDIDNNLSVPPLEELSYQLDEFESDLKQMKEQEELLKRTHNSYKEQEIVLKFGNHYYQSLEHEGQRRRSSDSQRELLVFSDVGPTQSSNMLSFITGVIPSSCCSAFERVVFRATRGNAVVKTESCEEKLMDASSKGEMVDKHFYMIFFSGEVLRQKVTKISTFFGATNYTFPESQVHKNELLSEISKRLSESSMVIERTQQAKVGMLGSVALKISTWTYTTIKEKMIFDAMNKFNFDIKRKVFVAQGWCPVSDFSKIRAALYSAARHAQLQTQPIIDVVQSPKAEPPTYIPTTPFSSGFQGLVNTYGTPRYRETNPGLFACIQFPFLFGIMFGDVGHGFFLFIFGFYLVSQYDKKFKGKKLDDMVEMCVNGRYIILMNGLFAIYQGTLYNEIFALPLSGPFLGSNFDPELGKMTATPAYGIDPIWHLAKNKLSFFNSYKMKISIVVGVIQMVFGIFLSLLNHIEYRKPINVIFEFIPQMLFMNCTFGYLVVLIFMKWNINWYVDRPDQAPPSLMNILINMFMGGGYCDPADEIFPGQGTLQFYFLTTALIAVPWMLFPKPIIVHYQNKAKAKYQVLGDDDGHSEDTHSFADDFVHQMIHTIEFTLGCVSNTASYLRLWALSLAHAELSELFWEMIMVKNGLDSGNFLVIFLMTCAWAVISFIVLMIMENLSSFLHALRLLWVEFMNKFYLGDGRPFTPFKYSNIKIEEE